MRAMTITVIAAILAAITGLVIAQYRQFTWGKMALHDYGIYYNMLWNTAHGHWFTYLTDQSYLSTHLSFTLALLAPLFLLWDHPCLLTVIQWLCFITGILVVWRILVLTRIPPFLTAAILFMFTAYPYAQLSMLSEFHGVHLYFFLIPWLYLCLAFRKDRVWIPLLLIAGLREDAVFSILPMLIYFTAADRWKTGKVWCLVCAAYGILALTVLFPWFNGISILERREHLLDPDAIRQSLLQRSFRRIVSAFRLFLPAAPLFFLRRRNWIPIVIFPSLPLLILLASPERHHFGIHRHYSTAIFTCLVLGIIEALRRSAPLSSVALAKENQPWRLASLLLLITVASHVCWGALPWGVSYAGREFQTASLYIPKMLRVTRNLPKEGVLLTSGRLAGYLGNRYSIVTFDSIRIHPHAPDYLVFDMKRIKSAMLFSLLKEREFGVIAFEPPFIVMKRGADPARNAEVLATIPSRPPDAEDSTP